MEQKRGQEPQLIFDKMKLQSPQLDCQTTHDNFLNARLWAENMQHALPKDFTIITLDTILFQIHLRKRIKFITFSINVHITITKIKEKQGLTQWITRLSFLELASVADSYNSPRMVAAVACWARPAPTMYTTRINATNEMTVSANACQLGHIGGIETASIPPMRTNPRLQMANTTETLLTDLRSVIKAIAERANDGKSQGIGDWFPHDFQIKV